MVTISYNALFATLKDSETILLKKLDDENAVNKTAAKKILDTILADDLILLAKYNTYNYPYLDSTTKIETGLAVSGYPSQIIAIEMKAKGQDLDTNAKISYHYNYTFPDGKKGNAESYIVDGYLYLKDVDGNRTKEKFDLQNYDTEDEFDLDDYDTFEGSAPAQNIMEKYSNVKIDNSSDGAIKITLVYSNSSGSAVGKAKNYADFWFGLDDMKETQYAVLCKKYEKSYTINTDGELISEAEVVELSYVEDGDTDTYNITRTESTAYNNIGKPVTVTLPSDLSSYREKDK